MKQFWLTFALTKYISEITSVNFFFFFNIAPILSFAFDG